MTKIISLNESSLFLWNTLHDREFTTEDAADALVGEYGIDAELARKDALAWCGKMAECGLLESCGETAECGPHDDEASVGEGGADVR